MPYTVTIPAALLVAAIVGTAFLSNAMTGHDAVWLAEMAAMR